MLGLSANLNYYLFNGNVDLRKGIFRLCESIREEMSLDPSDASNVYMFCPGTLNLLWDLYLQTDIRFTGCSTEKTQRCFI